MAGAAGQGLPTPHATHPASPTGSYTPAPNRSPILSPTPEARHSPLALKATKAASASDCHRLEDLPNIGPAMAADWRALGIAHPRELAHRDAFVLYQSLCALSGKRRDPIVLDTFMAATDFVRGAAPAPWWTYTAQRKRLYGAV